MAKKKAAGKTTKPRKAVKTKTTISKRRATATSREKSPTKRATTATSRKKTAARAGAARKRRSKPAPKAPSRIASVTVAAMGTLGGAVSAVTRRLPWSKAAPDAIEILEQDHRRFEDLLKQGEDTTERARKTRLELLARLESELNAHELMEERVLYPALQSHPEARDIVLEGYEEHHVADLILAELRDVATDDEQWGAKFKVLKENIEHHIEEEEGEMFRTARAVLSREDLRALGARMAAMKAGG